MPCAGPRRPRSRSTSPSTPKRTGCLRCAGRGSSPSGSGPGSASSPRSASLLPPWRPGRMVPGPRLRDRDSGSYGFRQPGATRTAGYRLVHRLDPGGAGTSVTSVALSRGAVLAATGGSAGSAQVWNVATGLRQGPALTVRDGSAGPRGGLQPRRRDPGDRLRERHDLSLEHRLRQAGHRRRWRPDLPVAVPRRQRDRFGDRHIDRPCYRYGRRQFSGVRCERHVAGNR
jgi:hypothetical protein